MTLKLVIYGDFNCPYSYLASARADALLGAGLAEVEWRAVEHDPGIPAPSRPVAGDLAETLDREVAEVSGLLRPHEALPIRRPPVQPNTAAAITAFAAAPDADRHGLRRRLFAALWSDGRDIGAGTVLDELGGGPAAAPAAAGLGAGWRDGWERLERRLVPMLVLPDGYVSRGLGALARLADLTADATARPAPAGDGA